MMREAVSLMGGYGVTEDCPGFLGQKWMDAQLEATYEGPEAVQRLQLSITMTNELFLAQFRQWIAEMKRIASDRARHRRLHARHAQCNSGCGPSSTSGNRHDADGAKLYHKTRQGVTFPLADALCWLLAARQFILDVLELESKGAEDPGLAGTAAFFTDLCHVQCARAAGEVGPHLRRNHPRPQPSSRLGRGQLPRLLPVRGAGRSRRHHSRNRLRRARSIRCHRGGTIASVEGRSVPEIRRPGGVCPIAREARRLPHRLPPRQRPRRRRVDQGHDPRGVGLSGVNKLSGKWQNEMKTRHASLEIEPVENLIRVIRGQRVILDMDLARVYGVPTKRLNEAVKRTSERFPSDFSFLLKPQEVACLRSQIATSTGRGGRRYSPRAFTEYGAIMAANVLNSQRAVQMSVFVVRAFVKMREVLAQNQHLAEKLAELEKRLTGRLDVHEKAIVHILEEIKKLMEPLPPPPEPKRREIGFHVHDEFAGESSVRKLARKR